jgi:hypothetical protein
MGTRLLKPIALLISESIQIGEPKVNLGLDCLSKHNDDADASTGQCTCLKVSKSCCPPGNVRRRTRLPGVVLLVKFPKGARTRRFVAFMRGYHLDTSQLKPLRNTTS